MLTKFRLVNTGGLKGLYFKGDLIPFDKIDDTKAEQLFGKTHVLERLPVAPVVLALAEAEPTDESAKKKGSE